MDGNVTWVDTELDANVGFFLLFFKKNTVGQKKKQFGFKRGWNMSQFHQQPETSVSGPVNNFF